MISITYQGDQRYNVCYFGEDIGCITMSRNPYHAQNCYIKLGLTRYAGAIARELFPLLRAELGRPLQVMLSSAQGMDAFLTAGGFERRRKCYELEVSPSNLTVQLRTAVPLEAAQKGSALYGACCERLYDYYSETHRAVSPLTATQEMFCAYLPDTVICCVQNGGPAHYAFVEPDEAGWEIAYVGSADLSGFPAFAQSLVHSLFQKCDSLTMECDDCDPAAMMVKALFGMTDGETFDTYVL